jgi:PAS domain S-box-containing protein
LSVLIFAVSYFVAYRYLTYLFGRGPSPFWAPNAVLLCALLLTPARNWIFYFIVTLVIRLLAPLRPDLPIWLVTATSTIDALDVLFTAVVMLRLAKASPRLRSLRDLSWFFASAVVVAPAVAALLGAAVHYERFGTSFWRSWLGWFLGDSLVHLVLTPAILYWATGGLISLGRASLSRWVEALLLMTGLVFVGVEVLGGDIQRLPDFPALLYIPMPFLIWAAVRFGPRGASLSLGLVAMLSIWYAVHNRGPFSAPSLEQKVLSIQLFLIVVSTPLLFLAVLVQSFQESESRYRQMFQQNCAVQLLVDPSTSAIVAANPAASQFYGYSLEQLQQMNLAQINTLPPEKIAEYMRRSITGERQYFNVQHRLASGEIRDVEVHSGSVDVGDRKLLHGIIHDVTERRQTSERFRRFFDLPLVGMAITSSDRRFLFVNQKLCDLLGYQADQLTGMSWVDVSHPDDVDKNVRVLQQTLSGETDGYTIDKRFIHRDGSIVYASISARAIRMQDGTVDHLVLTVQDITERKRAEAALRESEERFSKAFHASPQPMSLTTLEEGRYIDINQRFLEISGYRASEVIGQTSMNLQIWENAGARAEFVDPLREQGRVRNVETRFRTRAGEVRTWLSSAELIELDGRSCILMASSDITDLKQADVDLRESESRNQAVLRAIPDLMFLQTKDGVYIDYHARDPRKLLVPPEVFIGKKMKDVLPPEVGEVLENCFQRAIISDEPVVDEYSLPVDGGVGFYECRIVPCGDDKILSIVRDITERKLVQASLEQALAEVRLLKDQLLAENVYLQEAVLVAHDFGEMVGDSPALKKVLQQAQQVAPLDTTVMILGETGTGKELLAHAIHNLSGRKNRPLITVNCAALPAHLIEDELFGHEKGAFTGAHARRSGRFEIASGATIFLDEIGELPLDLQAKLLRVIQEGEFERLGGSRTIKVDVRLIAATNRNLEAAVRGGAFRADLFYRLSVYPITIPPLRDRKEDISALVMHFVKQLNARLGKRIESISQWSLDALLDYHWPGNIRELRNVIERAAIITTGNTLILFDSPDAGPLRQQLSRLNGVQGPVQPEFNGMAPIDVQSSLNGPPETLEESERNLIIRTLDRTGGRIEGPRGAAAMLAIHPSTLRSRMRKLGVPRSRFIAGNIA